MLVQLVASAFTDSVLALIIYFIQGIAPTIIAVRVGLGCSVESVDSFIGSGARPPTPTQILFSSVPRRMAGGDNVIYIRPESLKVGHRDEEECV